MTTRTEKRRRNGLRAIAAIVALIVVAAPLLGCGDDDEPTPSASGDDGRQGHLTLSEVEAELERRQLSLVRTGSGSTSTDRNGLVDLVEYQAQPDQQFELFVFTSPDAAQRELPSVVAEAREQHGEDATAVPAANAVAVFRGRPSSGDAYREAADVMSRLGAACIRGSDAEKRLQRLCFGE
ncbi:MAG TPA: hypothetical protein VGR11_13520 [Solirubrobacteraceae bacterium]|nr:hypothetical protein [Solirubrobacteraceae bacterium]